MKPARVLLLASLLIPGAAFAVYAPIPEQEQGKALAFTLSGGVGYDSNIFGAAVNPISSVVYNTSLKGAFNASISEQSFASAFYTISADTYTDRPGTKTLVGHELFARLAHSFGQTTTADVYDYFQYSRNPESLLNGLPLNTDQSYKRNQLDARFTTSLTAKFGIDVKGRNTLYRFDNAALSRDLDRVENLVGLAGSYDVLPETKAVFEYRHQDIQYRYAGELKDKRSDFGLVGFDYQAGERLSASVRAGIEQRIRKSEDSVNAPSAELSLKYAYAKGSYVTAGYAYLIDETSNTLQFTDSRINRFFVNVQHGLSERLIASFSGTVEPATLQAREDLGLSNVRETTYRVGAGLSYLPYKNWMVSLTYDMDRVFSAESSRDLLRHRVDLSVVLAF